MNTETKFVAMMDALPLLESDAVIVLCGQDAPARTNVGMEIMQRSAAQMLVLSGGRSDPPEHVGALEIVLQMLGWGLDPDRILVDSASMNTLEQAEEVVKICVGKEWTKIMLAVSPYHSYRAFLTFVAVLRRLNRDHDIRVTVAPAGTKWWDTPPGSESTRVSLLDLEFQKIREHQKTGNVATYAEGVAYISHWEGIDP
jgi:uncharacterized SAM-binding protein YcdF (DUF218 family)